ncbi:MAG TPA: NAD(P)-dependent oxidoreductase, partial [Armatimonadota bacterium]|nr:NAD(P)-dependent oxidoreductase [Armatimonadota bacterium]
ITDLAQVRPLMDGVDAVMHMAIASGRDFRKRRDEFREAELDVNVKGTYNVLEAARRAGVTKVVIASSVTATFGYPSGRYVTAGDPPCVNSLYAATKYFAEVLGEMYSRMHGMSVICWRIGLPTDTTDVDVMHRFNGRHERVMLVSFTDLANGFALAAEADGVPFGVFPLLSDNPEAQMDVTHPRFVLGYQPVHRFTDGRVETLRDWP